MPEWQLQAGTLTGYAVKFACFFVRSSCLEALVGIDDFGHESVGGRRYTSTIWSA